MPTSSGIQSAAKRAAELDGRLDGGSAEEIKFGRTTEKGLTDVLTTGTNIQISDSARPNQPCGMSAEAKHCSGTQSNEQRQRGDVPLCRLDKPLVLFSLEQHASWFFPFAVRCVVAPSGRGGC